MTVAQKRLNQGLQTGKTFPGPNLIIDAVRHGMLFATEIQPLSTLCDSFQSR